MITARALASGAPRRSRATGSFSGWATTGCSHRSKRSSMTSKPGGVHARLRARPGAERARSRQRLVRSRAADDALSPPLNHCANFSPHSAAGPESAICPARASPNRLKSARLFATNDRYREARQASRGPNRTFADSTSLPQSGRPRPRFRHVGGCRSSLILGIELPVVAQRRVRGHPKGRYPLELVSKFGLRVQLCSIDVRAISASDLLSPRSGRSPPAVAAVAVERLRIRL